MSKAFEIGFIGAGNMAKAILKGILSAGICPAEKIILSNRSKEKLEKLKQTYSVTAAADNKTVARSADVVIIAVKPQQFLLVAEEIKAVLDKETVVVSIMAGVTVESIMEALDTALVLRAMPNTPAQIAQGLTAVCRSDKVNDAVLEKVTGIFATVGETIIIDESLIDAVSAISGCGPAYIYQMIEALADGGVMIGIPRAMAYQLAAWTMVGAGKMVLETNEHPAVLKDMVTSPAGSTIRALNVLEQGGLRGTLMAAVEAAYLKSKQLGEIK